MITVVKFLYLMQVGVMPEYDIPVVCYLVQTTDGKNILIDTGLPEVLPGIELIETSGHCVGHQSVLLRMPKSGNILLAVDAVPFAEWYTREKREDDPEGETLPSTIKLMDLEKKEKALLIFGHDVAQWATLKTLPQRYE